MGDRKLAGGQEQRPRTPYLNKGELAAVFITGAQQAPGGEGVGGRCVGGFVLRFFFFPFVAVVFLFYRFQFWVFNSRGLGKAWQRYPHGPFQSGSCQLLQPALKLQAHLHCRHRVIYLPGLSNSTFSRSIAHGGYSFPPALKMPVTAQSQGELGSIFPGRSWFQDPALLRVIFLSAQRFVT